MSAKLFIDGGSRGNPGMSAIAYILKDNQDLVLAQHKELIGIGTNNEAEYRALQEGVLKALEMGLILEELHIYSDSKLLVEQMRDNWQVKNGWLARLKREVQDGLQHFKSVEFHHIPREKNAEADRLVNEAFSLWT